ncbi:hypothetical protein ACLB2K_037468 [Fragaria x ananassa]
MVIDHTIIEKKEELELMDPEKFRSSISLEFMNDLVTLASGHIYDEGNLIAQCMSLEHQTCLKSGHKLVQMVYVSNYALKSLLYHWRVKFHALVSCSRDFVIAIMGDAENNHNNVAEANAYIDGKMYDFSVIMQSVMISSTRPLDELKGNLCIVHKYIEKKFAGVHEVSVVSWNVNLLAACVKSDEEIQLKVRVHALEKEKDKRTKAFTAGQTLVVLTVVGMNHSSSFGFLTGTEKYVEAEKVCVDDEVANHASTEA